MSIGHYLKDIGRGAHGEETTADSTRRMLAGTTPVPMRSLKVWQILHLMQFAQKAPQPPPAPQGTLAPHP